MTTRFWHASTTQLSNPGGVSNSNSTDGRMWIMMPPSFQVTAAFEHRLLYESNLRHSFHSVNSSVIGVTARSVIQLLYKMRNHLIPTLFEQLTTIPFLHNSFLSGQLYHVLIIPPTYYNQANNLEEATNRCHNYHGWHNRPGNDPWLCNNAILHSY